VLLDVVVGALGPTSLYGPRLVRKFSPHELQTSRSTSRDSGYDQIVAQLRSQGPGVHQTNPRSPAAGFPGR
jgi:hypothetical protein